MRPSKVSPFSWQMMPPLLQKHPSSFKLLEVRNGEVIIANREAEGHGVHVLLRSEDLHSLATSRLFH